MTRHLVLSLGLLMVAAPSLARAEGIDCGKAKVPVDRAICADPTVKALDGKVARQYAKVRALIDDDAVGKDFVARQRAWIAARDAACPDAQAACLGQRYAERLDDLTALAAATDSRSPVLKAADAVILQGQWKATGYLTPDGPVERVDNMAVGWGLPELDRTIIGRPGTLCTQKDQSAKPYCASFGLQKTTLAAIPGGDKMAAGLTLPPTTTAFVMAGGVNPSDLLIPLADGSLLAEFKACRDAALQDCHFAYQVWKPVSDDARLSVH
ncbi:MAG TPA: lysozyme inhibitor LprI family protein [Aliidongia sp.]|uniref:lysozyme inhibitor LprI family protein n=1 Tax=Aliidongia sp. TaxID=1914230 RepID=UPI002DDCBCBB|nr:lysozyme inhibitor LprI family protein [Aliidongia sp.]HEV2674467.1 lysozyme inhibitor LprI family protein [Aliidongia sp.]